MLVLQGPLWRCLCLLLHPPLLLLLLSHNCKVLAQAALQQVMG
jgi:hypothetical protein